MAIANKMKAGQWSKNRALRTVERQYWIIAGLVLLLGVAAGLSTGASLARYVPSLARAGWVVAAVVMVPLLFCRHAFFTAMSRYMTQRVKFLRGGQAEGLVFWTFRDQLDHSWYVFNNIQLDEARDIDHVVIGRRGVFLVSTKASRGHLTLGADGAPLFNNRPTDLVADTLRQTMRFKDRLAALLGSDVPYVHAVLAMPLAFTEVPVPYNGVIVANQDDLIERVEAAHRNGPTIDRVRIMLAIQGLAETNRRIERRPPQPPSQPPMRKAA